MSHVSSRLGLTVTYIDCMHTCMVLTRHHCMLHWQAVSCDIQSQAFERFHEGESQDMVPSLQQIPPSKSLHMTTRGIYKNKLMISAFAIVQTKLII